jgi:iron only hydrogenase large subunit-like protein
MPCYDKKLEAVRPNFSIGENKVADGADEIKEVDTVLATHELVELIQGLQLKEGISPSIESFSKISIYQWSGEEVKLDGLPDQAKEYLSVMRMFVDAACSTEKFRQVAILNTTSNGYLEYIFRRASKEIFGVHIDPLQPLQYIQGKNKDLKETILEVDGKVVLRFAAAYGFRNIQNIIRNIKRGKCEYEYVEIMACPGGCLNGGGQIKPKDFGGLDP